MATTLLGLPLLTPGQADAVDVLNRAIVILSALQGGYVDKRDDPPNAADHDQEVYRVGASPTDEWSAFTEDDLAIAISGKWYQLTPTPGLTIYDESAGSSVQWNGSAWA